MPFSILDLDDAMLEGKAQLNDIFEEAQRDFYGPILDIETSQMWQDLPDEMKLLLRHINPKAVEKVERKFGGK